jgi:hypothetical protein
METVIRAAMKEAVEAAMEVVTLAAMEAVIRAAIEAVIRAAMEEAVEAVMERQRAAIEEGTGIQRESGSESASENVGIQDSHHDCLRGAETLESQLQLVELVLELVVNSVELVEQLLKCFFLQAPVCEETTKDN